MMAWRAIYGVVTYLALPFALAYFVWRSRAEPDYRRHWRERLGWAPRFSPGTIWIHAASVGEVVLAAALVTALDRHATGRRLLVTTMTPTGRAEALRRFGDRATIAYVPLDTPGAAQRFVARARPATGIFVETELWPNLINAASRAGVRLALINANLSERSAARYRNPVFSGAMRFMLSRFGFIGAAGPVHADRFRSLGAAVAAVAVTGNLKYDLSPKPGDAGPANPLRDLWRARTRPIWIAASTHAPEESELLRVFARLRERHPTLLLLIAPRHPQRFTAVAGLISAAGWRWARRSLNEAVNQATDIVLVDTLGELSLFYAVADVAFVGGSLVDGIGGHNVIEPAAAARPLVTGPNIREWLEPLRELAVGGGAVIAEDIDALTRTLDAWLSEPQKRRRDGAAAAAAVNRHRGALQRTTARLTPLLPGDDPYLADDLEAGEQDE